MLDIKLIRENPDKVKEGIRKRELDLDGVVDDILLYDEKRRELTGVVDGLRAEQNTVSKKIPKMKKAGENTDAIIKEMQELSETIKTKSAELEDYEEKQTDNMLQLPNIPDEDIVAGGKENNVAVETYLEKPTFSFTPKDHMQLSEELDLVDYKRGVKLGGNGNWLYKGKGAKLEWALLNFFIDEHTADGYEFLMIPHMLGWEAGYVAGQFPKFADEVFIIKNPATDEKKFMLPTSETALVNVHRDEILAKDELPKKYVAYSPCYRREAGSYRAEERGMIRGHQFNKVEMFQYAAQEDSEAAFETLVAKAEKIMQKLGLHHQVSKLAAADVSASMARTYDIEVWIPSMEIYKEVSSVSNARSFQTRRGNIRYRDDAGKLHFAHTLNGSGLATSRVFPAILEQYQNEDGSVTIPEVLQKYTGFDKIEPK